MTNETKAAKTMTCEACHVDCQRFGKHRNGLRRFRCPNCKKTYTEAHERTLGSMYVPQEQAELAVQLLVEGNSLRSTQRITKLDVNTIMRVLVLAGERCQSLMDSKMRNLRPAHLQLDEIWTYCGKKQRHIRKGDSPELGDQVGVRSNRRGHKVSSRVSCRQASSCGHANFPLGFVWSHRRPHSDHY